VPRFYALVLALVLAVPSTAHAVTLFYTVTVVLDSGGMGTGHVSADDAGFTPDGLVPLDDLDILFDFPLNLAYPRFELVECSTAQGRVNGAGTGLAAVQASCTDGNPDIGTNPMLEMAFDGQADFVYVPNVVFVPGTYTLTPQALPEPGPMALLAVCLAGARAARRLRV